MRRTSPSCPLSTGSAGTAAGPSRREHTPQLRPSPSQELVALAAQVRTLLAAYDPEDPAVAALKQSPVYQKVAYLIEGAEGPVMGGIAQ